MEEDSREGRNLALRTAPSATDIAGPAAPKNPRVQLNEEPQSKRQSPLVELVNVKKYYGQVKALDDISFSAREGEFISFVGASGAGKSTLVKLLIREERPSAGEIRVAGRNIGALSFADVPFYRRKLGVVFQDFKLLPQKTVAENVAYALEICDVDDAEIRERVPKILSLVGLVRFAKRYPHEISRGEQQRTAIARALVHNPQIVVADEPTGNLDPESSLEVIETFKKINQTGTLVILASHNKAIVDNLKRRVILLRDGKIISDQNPGRYAL